MMIFSPRRLLQIRPVKHKFSRSFCSKDNRDLHDKLKDLQKVLEKEKLADIIENPERLSEIAKSLDIPEHLIKDGARTFLENQETARYKKTSEVFHQNVDADNRQHAAKYDPDQPAFPDPVTFLDNPCP